MEEWKTYKLSEIGNIVGGATPSTKIAENYDGDIPWITPKDLSDFSGRFIKHGERNITQQGFDSCSCQMLPKNSVLFSSRAPIGYVAIAAAPLCTNQGFKSVVPNEEIVDPRFLYYLLKFNKDRIAGMGSGTTFMEVSGGVMKNVEVSLPVIAIQKHIAEILSSIDDKIELNNRINHNLEEQAQALYKSWFVDFEPFKGGNFVDSELGMIPEGWRVGCYNDIISSTVSGDWGKDREVGNYTHKVSCIRGCDFADVSSGIRGKTPERFVLEKNFQNKRLLDKDIIVEISGGTPTVSTGRICLVSDNLLDKYSGNIVCTNFCRVIRPCSGYSSYVFYSWLDKYNSRVMFGYENGTSGIKNFQISDFMEKEPVIIPPQTVIAQFQTIVDVYQAVIQRNGNERMECETVRDALLPKLMSGELKINDLTC